MRLRIGEAAGLGQRLGRLFVAFALVSAVAALSLEASLRDTALVNAAAILGFVGLERLAAHLWPSRPVSFVRFLLLTHSSQSISIILVIFVDGRLEFGTSTGGYSLADGSALVVAVGLALNAAMLVGGRLMGAGPLPEQGSWQELMTSLPTKVFAASCAIAGAILLGRLLLLFGVEAMPLPLVYGLRLFVSYFLAVFAFVGAALRLKYHPARLVTFLAGLVSPVVVLSGSRADALLPLALLALGYVVAQPMPKQRLIRFGAYGGLFFVLAMFVGDVVRGDSRGRTGEAALERVGDLGTVVSEQSNVEAISTASLRRMISFSAHAVITRIPDELPFEQDGLLNLPGEFASKLLPRFNLSGISDIETPRNWMLNELGFLVNWATSVELSLVADAWYRGGWLGLLAVGLFFGALLQFLENLVYRGMRTRPALFVVLVFVVSSLVYVAGRDVVTSVRNTVFTVIAALMLFAATGMTPQRRLRRRSPQYAPHAASATDQGRGGEAQPATR